MNLIATAAISCVVAGFLMIILGFALSWREMTLRARIRDAAIGKPEDTTAAHVAAMKAVIPDPVAYVKSLAELAKNLSGLSPAVASFIIATILFFFAMTLGAVNYAVK
jgi:Flp pilus assembly protein TadB